MNKYDFGYKLIEGSTIEWAYSQISSGSVVLELGPSNGNLIYHLTSEKGCIADIVEIDEEAGTQAARYARNSCLGEKDGNLEKDIWFQKLQGNEYDYIIILDVLEHIRNAEKMLDKLRGLLKPEGIIFLSIPNIAHNAVIMNLMLNKFEYTPVGLLDDTHVHFYTYNSIKQMLNTVGLITIEEKVIQEDVGKNEIAVDYGVLPSNVEAYLKTRAMGTAYQFLLTIQKGKIQPQVELEYKEELMYEAVAFNAKNGDIIGETKLNPLNVVNLECHLKEKTDLIRIDPLDANCILANIKIEGIIGNSERRKLEIKEFTGNQINDLYIFYDNDPQIYVEVTEEIEKLCFYCDVLAFDDEGIGKISEMRDVIRGYQADMQQMKTIIADKDIQMEKIVVDKDAQIEEICALKEQLYEEIAASNMSLNETKAELTRVNNELERTQTWLNNTCNELKVNIEEKERILNSIWGKLYCKSNGLKRRLANRRKNGEG